MSGTIDHVNVTLKIDSQLNSPLDLSTAFDPILINQLITFSNGTATGTCSQHWSDTRTLTASATENLDMAASIVNVFGTTLTFAKLKVVYVKAAAANTNDVQFQRATTNGVPLFMAATDGIALAPGEIFLYVSPGVGKTVTAATGDIFTITNSAGGTSVSYDIVLIGTD